MAADIPPQLTDLLDRAVLDPRLWQGVCDEIASNLDGVGTVLVPEDVTQQGPWVVHSASLQPLISAVFRDEWHKRNYRRKAIPLIKKRGYATDLDIADTTALRREPFYNDLLAKQNIGCFIGLHFEVGNQSWIASVERAADAPLPDQATIDLANRIRPLLASAVRTSAALGSRRFEDWRSLLADPGRAVFMIDRQGRVLARNETSESYLSAGLLLKGRSLHLSDPVLDKAFETLVDVARSALRGATLPPPVVWRNAGGQILHAEAVPVNPDLIAFHEPTAALVIVRRVLQPAFAMHELLKQTVGLTAAEARLAVALSAGTSVQDYAASVGNSVGTVRNQLKSIFRKTKTGRQGELVAWVRRLDPWHT